MDKLRSIGKQTRESVESVLNKSVSVNKSTYADGVLYLSTTAAAFSGVRPCSCINCLANISDTDRGFKRKHVRHATSTTLSFC